MNHLFRFSLVLAFLFGNDALQVRKTLGPITGDTLPIQRRDVVMVTSISTKIITTIAYVSHIGTAQIPESEPVPTGPPYARCSLGRCLLDSGAVINGESMERHLTPDTRFLMSGVRYANHSSIIGDIILNIPDDVPKLPLAILLSGVYRAEENKFTQWISDSRGITLGSLIVKRPMPDPDTRFESIANDSLLAAIPTCLRSVADPSFLLPSSTKACETRKCLNVVAVSNHIIAHSSLHSLTWS